MSSKDARLYGHRPESRTKSKEISSASSLAFASTLSSLIKASASDPSKPTTGRVRTKKDDIFKSHNKDVKKRAAKDLEDSDFTQKHRGRTVEEKVEDERNYKRAKRRMEEKARLYDALKRGDIEDLDDKYGVDFDRKWAEKDSQQRASSPSDSDSSSAASHEEQVAYTDEFGRSRSGTRAQAARATRRQRTLAAAAEPDRFTARPSMPATLIHGDAIQSGAFQPSAPIAAQMAELAAKRDRSLTPPPEVHFDGHEEVRVRGTGFMHFSRDEGERARQMRALEEERAETERRRRERREAVERRRREVGEKRRRVEERRREGRAEKFLEELGAELMSKSGAEGAEQADGEGGVGGYGEGEPTEAVEEKGRKARDAGFDADSA